MFAIIETGGKQYRVTAGDILRVEKLPAEVKNSITFDQVLLIADGDKVEVGTPVVTGAKVTAEVVRNAKAKKVTVIKYKSKIRYKKTVGHRQQFTEVKIDKITA